MRIRNFTLAALFNFAAMLAAAIVFLVAAIALVAATARADADPCRDPSRAHFSAAINVTAAGTSVIVAAVASQAIHVCGWNFTATGTSPTIEFEQGTQTTTPCDTGPAALTGTFAPAAGSYISSGGAAGSVFSAAAGDQLCVVAGGTGPGVQGVLTYVQP